jgi:hypothetical protein
VTVSPSGRITLTESARPIAEAVVSNVSAVQARPLASPRRRDATPKTDRPTRSTASARLSPAALVADGGGPAAGEEGPGEGSSSDGFTIRLRRGCVLDSDRAPPRALAHRPSGQAGPARRGSSVRPPGQPCRASTAAAAESAPSSSARVCSLHCGGGLGAIAARVRPDNRAGVSFDTRARNLLGSVADRPRSWSEVHPATGRQA